MQIRVFEQPEIKHPFAFGSSKQVYEKVKDYSKADREMFIIMFLDTCNRVLESELHSIGTVNSSPVYPREIFRSALLKNATSIICVHNHPGGDPTPSEQDKFMTEEILRGCKLLGIEFLDHIILGGESYYSFADMGNLINESNRIL